MERSQHEREQAVLKAEERAADELMRLEWLRSQARLWQMSGSGEDGTDG